MAFTMLLVLFSRPTTDSASLAISLSLIGPLLRCHPETLPVLLRSRIVLPYRAVRKHLGAVGESECLRPIVRARPCPTFGRPVHHRGGPRRLRPDTSPHTLRIPPHDGHPVLRSAAKSGFRFTLAVSSFRLRARLGFSIPSLFSGQRDVNPAFGYSAPHLSAGGTSTLLNNALLSAHYEPIRNPLVFHRFPGFASYTVCCSADFSSGRGGLLQLLSASLSSCCR